MSIKTKALVSFLIIFIYSFSLDSIYVSSPGKDSIKEFALQYKRSITILEICDGTEIYCEDIINDPRIDCTLVILLSDDTTNEINNLISKQPKNVIVLRPKPLSFDILEKLSGCEQPDITVIHDIPVDKFKLKNYPILIEIGLRLGDYLIMDVCESVYLHKFKGKSTLIKTVDNKNGRYFVFSKCNPGFMISRWTTKAEDISPSSVTRKACSAFTYNVISDFNQKIFEKSYFTLNAETQLCDKYTDRFGWAKGINLVTFVILSGIYPLPNTLLQQIRSWHSLNHNDLVMSNIIIQGTELYPIDRADKRRNFQIGDAIQLLEIAFKDTRLMCDPDSIVDDYFNRIRQYSRNKVN
jgi:hypothetical protein